MNSFVACQAQVGSFFLMFSVVYIFPHSHFSHLHFPLILKVLEAKPISKLKRGLLLVKKYIHSPYNTLNNNNNNNNNHNNNLFQTQGPYNTKRCTVHDKRK